ncbi:MAG: hypothetical protein LM573_04165 [Thermofilum sp.]|nr:hypothetical protein [Thermofilum sp.]
MAPCIYTYPHRLLHVPTTSACNIYYYKYTGTGTDSKWQQVSYTQQNANFNTVFELKIPLSLLGLKPQQKITIYIIPEQRWFLHRPVPKTATSLRYPTTQTAALPKKFICLSLFTTLYDALLLCA